MLLGLWLLGLGTSCTSSEVEGEQMVNLEEMADRPEAQLSNLTNAIARTGGDGSLYARRAIVLLRQGELTKALADANEAVRLSKRDPATWFVKAQVLRALGRQDEALALALQAERNSYQSSSLFVLLGDLYLQRHDYRQARAYINQALDISPADEYAFYYRGRIQAETGDTARAVRSYKKALEQAPDFMEPQRELAGIYLARKEFETAGGLVQSAMALASDNGQLWLYKGLLHQVRQQPDSALVSFEKALALNDTLQGAHFWLGLELHQQGDNVGAIEHLEKAASTYGNNLKFMATLANCYERIGQYQKSLEQYQRLLAAEPRYTYVHQSISRLKSKIQGPRVITADTSRIELKSIDIKSN